MTPNGGEPHRLHPSLQVGFLTIHTLGSAVLYIGGKNRCFHSILEQDLHITAFTPHSTGLCIGDFLMLPKILHSRGHAKPFRLIAVVQD